MDNQMKHLDGGIVGMEGLLDGELTDGHLDIDGEIQGSDMKGQSNGRIDKINDPWTLSEWTEMQLVRLRLG